MNRFFNYLIIAFIFWQPLIATQQPSIYETIEKQHMRSFQAESVQPWDETSFYKYVMRYFKEQQHPNARKKRELGFTLLKSNRQTKQPIVLDHNSWEDLNLFFNKSGPQYCLGEIVNRAQTEVGRITLYRLLAQPIADKAELHKRQLIIRELMANEYLFDALSDALRQMQKNENLVLAFWDNDSFKTTSRSLYYDMDGIRGLNNSAYALAYKNICDNAQRGMFLATNAAATLILPLYTFSRIMHLANPGWFDTLSGRLMGMSGPVAAFGSMIENPWIQGSISLASATCCGLWAMSMLDWQRGSLALNKVLGIRVTHTAAFITAMRKAATRASRNKLLSQMPAVQLLQQFFDPQTPQEPNVTRLIQLLTTDEIACSSFIMKNSKELLAYKLMNEAKDDMVPAIAAAGEIDAYVSIASLYKECASKPVSFSFAQFEDADTPHISLTNFWNPFISAEQVVANSVELGGCHRNNMIVTGPNAGGKSTTLKGIAISLIMAQTFGIVPAQQAIITPFTNIASYLNITDDIVAGHSLFKAEVIRAHNLIETVEKLGPKEFSFVILDEIFNGTSPREGEAAAYGTAKHLGSFDRSIAIVATHFEKLTLLEKATDSFTNYRVRVNRLPNTQLHYPFIIEPGISDQNIALDMLRLEGFKSEILKEATAILNLQNQSSAEKARY